MKVDADCLGGGELKAVHRHPVLNAVNTQLHSSLLCLMSFCSHTKLSTNKSNLYPSRQGWRQDTTLLPHLLLMQLQQSKTHSNLERTFRQEVLNKPGEMAPETKIPEVRQNVS